MDNGVLSRKEIMGYDLHITRRESWLDDGNDITKAEYEALIRTDSEFTYPSGLGDGYAEWTSPKSGYKSWLYWNEGRIQTKNPKPEFIDKMVHFAKLLQANVQGDEGEVYLSSTEVR